MLKFFAGLGLLLLTAVIGVAVTAEGSKPAMAAEKPASAFVVTSCGHFVTVYITWKDGHVTLIDSAHHAGYDDTDKVKDLVLSADQNKVFDMDCTAVGHDSV